LEHNSAFAASVLDQWRRRENLLPGLALAVLALAGWAYVAYQAGTIDAMEAMSGAKISTMGGFVPFVMGWTVMMVAMMIPATLPLILLYTVAQQRLSPVGGVRVGIAALLFGYIAVWAVAGLPVYLYALTAEAVGLYAIVLPAVLLVIGGAYQFTALKRSCHARCSSPLFFLMQKWRPGAVGALRLGVAHGLDCLGCCVGVMVGLVALGMMNLALVFTAALIIFAEKTLPESHRIARTLGILMMSGGIVLLGFLLLGGMEGGMEMSPETEMVPGTEEPNIKDMDSEMVSM
jgi:predicted metal-binding membrane protein